MKNYSIQGDLIVCNSWFGVAELHADYGLFRDIHMLKFLMEIDKIRSVTMNIKSFIDSKDFQKAKDLTDKYVKENNLSVESIISILNHSEEYEKHLDDLPNLVPQSLKGKKIILTGLQANSFSGPKIIQL